MDQYTWYFRNNVKILLEQFQFGHRPWAIRRWFICVCNCRCTSAYSAVHAFSLLLYLCFVANIVNMRAQNNETSMTSKPNKYPCLLYSYDYIALDNNAFISAPIIKNFYTARKNGTQFNQKVLDIEGKIRI